MEVRELRLEEEGEVPEVRVVLHFFLDCLDAMGANMVNTLAEALASRIAARHGVRSGLRILSNLADRRLVRAFVEIPFRDLDMPDFPGEAVAEGIASASRFAMVDPYRAATHNKGVFNGIDAVLIATGNDWRAVEAGAHAWAARGGRYTPLSSWRARDGVLRGRIELPMQLGVVGGTLKVHPSVRANLRILGVTSARELAMIATSLGLVQNLAALRALATRGIQEGHMRMHARAVALEVGADELELPLLVARMIEAREYSQAFARHTLEALRCGR
jgi:hydroxymethylglutaryl-CoA reductase